MYPIEAMETKINSSNFFILIKLLCKEKNIKGYSGKKKEEIAKLLIESQSFNDINEINVIN